MVLVQASNVLTPLCNALEIDEYIQPLHGPWI